MVQTNQNWWNNAKLLKYVDSQEEMNNYSDSLVKASAGDEVDFYFSNRKWLFMARFYLYSWLFKWHFRFGFDFKFYQPGLEVKKACEAAESVGANLQFLGSEFNANTWTRLNHETRFNIPEYLIKRYQYVCSNYSEETIGNRQKLSLVGPSAFTENCLD